MAQNWSGQTGGTYWMQRTLVRIIRHTDIRFVYGLMHLWLVWYVLVRPCERRGAYHFHRHRGRNPIMAAMDVYRSFCHFGRAIVDHDTLEVGKRLLLHTLQGLRHITGLIETGDDHGY